MRVCQFRHIRILLLQYIYDSTFSADRQLFFLKKRCASAHPILGEKMKSNQPFKEPIMTPLTKYFWIQGYRIRIGTVATMTVAYLIVKLMA